MARAPSKAKGGRAAKPALSIPGAPVHEVPGPAAAAAAPDVPSMDAAPDSDRDIILFDDTDARAQAAAHGIDVDATPVVLPPDGGAPGNHGGYEHLGFLEVDFDSMAEPAWVTAHATRYRAARLWRPGEGHYIDLATLTPAQRQVLEADRGFTVELV